MVNNYRNFKNIRSPVTTAADFLCTEDPGFRPLRRKPQMNCTSLRIWESERWEDEAQMADKRAEIANVFIEKPTFYSVLP